MNSPSATGFLAAARGDASVIGVVLLLGMTVVGTTTVVALGAIALDDTQRQSELQRGEHAMAQFDSRAAQVALGESATQTVAFPGDAGDFSSDPTAGRITITHVNYDGESDDDGNSVDDGSTDDDEELYSGTLGTVAYRNGGTVIAYQGGGVWRREGAGGVRMVSPPEFHYRSGTLTFPVVQVTEGDGGAGDVRAVIEKSSPVAVQYPDEGADYNGASAPDRTYHNPLSQGHVVISVESEFYAGWAEYFRERTDGTVTEYPDEERVTLELLTKGNTGQFEMPNDQSNGGGGVRVQGIDEGHALTDFSFTIRPKTNQNSRFKNLRWGMFVDEGQRKFELSFRGNGGDCSDTVPYVVYYSDDGHATYQGWSGSATVECVDGAQHHITLDLADNTTTLTYGSVQKSDLTHFKDDVGTLQSAGTLAGHPDATGHDADRTYASGEGENVDFVVAHYFAELGPTFDLQTEDQQSGGAAGVDEDVSNGYIDYEGGDRVVTYLHITENGIAVRFE